MISNNRPYHQVDPVKVILLVIFIGIIALLAIIAKLYWDSSIHNKANQPYVIEVAFNLDIEPNEVTQKQFNARYHEKH